MKLNWGCGVKKFHMEGWVNLDNRQSCMPDVLWDITDTPWCIDGRKIRENSVAAIRADNLLEHIGWGNDGKDILMHVLNEAHRVMRVGGVFWIRVPDAVRWPWGAFRDPTHRRYFCDGSFDYWDGNHFTYKNYGRSYGYKPWRVGPRRSVKQGKDAFFLEVEMFPIK